MKKILLILLCVPLMFSCGEEEKEKEECGDNKKEEVDKTCRYGEGPSKSKKEK